MARLNRVRLVALVLGVLLSAACSAGDVPGAAPAGTSMSATARSETAIPTVVASSTPTSVARAPVRQGTAAASERLRFVPARIELPGGEGADVEPESTADGVLQVPDDVTRVGWWNGSAYAGDPFGSTVIAGHVDSREQGLGFFAALLLVQDGDLITLRSGSQSLTYRVNSTMLVKKEALAADGRVLGQVGPHRLVLITCSGEWHPEIRSYDSNLVVVAEPVPV